MKKILLSLAGLLAFASIGMAADTPVLGQANSAAVERYAKRYIAHPDGEYILKGILWVESKNGKYKKGNGSYGIAQIEITTARYVAEKYGFEIPETDEAIRETLMFNDALSIKIAAAYLGLLEKTFATLDHMIVAYNLGPTKLRSMEAEEGGAPTVYLRKVMAEVGRHKMVAMASAEDPSSTIGKKAVLLGARLTQALANRVSPYIAVPRPFFRHEGRLLCNKGNGIRADGFPVSYGGSRAFNAAPAYALTLTICRSAYGAERLSFRMPRKKYPV